MLAVASAELTRAIDLLQTNAYEELDELGRRSTSTVIDLDAEQATCPACFGTIPQGSSRCPECGLRIG